MQCSTGRRAHGQASKKGIETGRRSSRATNRERRLTLPPRASLSPSLAVAGPMPSKPPVIRHHQESFNGPSRPQGCVAHLSKC